MHRHTPFAVVVGGVGFVRSPGTTRHGKIISLPGYLPATVDLLFRAEKPGQSNR